MLIAVSHEFETGVMGNRRCQGAAEVGAALAMVSVPCCAFAARHAPQHVPVPCLLHLVQQQLHCWMLLLVWLGQQQ